MKISEKLSKIHTRDVVVSKSMKIFLELVSEHEEFVKTMESQPRPGEDILKAKIEPQGTVFKIIT